MATDGTRCRIENTEVSTCGSRTAPFDFFLSFSRVAVSPGFALDMNRSYVPLQGVSEAPQAKAYGNDG